MSRTSFSFALFGNTFQSEKSTNIKEVIDNITTLGGDIYIEKDFAVFLEDSVGLHLGKYNIFENVDGSMDFALSIGGDGTFLKTVQQIGQFDIPIIGINTGRLGFISDVPPLNSMPFFENLFSGKYQLESRSLLQCRFNDGQNVDNPFALNEVAILKHDMSSMISISTYVNENYLATYQADGLIVSTPTGSTGYSLSVGGPIISPDSKSIIISPIAAHSLSVRPFVLNDNVQVSLKVKSRSRNFMIAIDGKSASFRDSTTIIINKAPNPIHIVRSLDHSFFSTLRKKLLWGADKR